MTAYSPSGRKGDEEMTATMTIAVSGKPTFTDAS